MLLSYLISSSLYPNINFSLTFYFLTNIYSINKIVEEILSNKGGLYYGIKTTTRQNCY